MKDKHNNFDADKLFARKANHCGFMFCPLCGEQMEYVSSQQDVTCMIEVMKCVKCQKEIEVKHHEDGIAIFVPDDVEDE